MANQPRQPSPALAVPPLVGREREQAVLRAALATALAGHGSLILIGGEAGVGKTALAEILCQEATERGALVLIGRCYDLSETPPYGPWRGAFAKVPPAGDLPPLPTAVLSPERSGVALGSQGAILARVQAHLVALATRLPLLLLLDDLHWADPASLDLLRIIAREVLNQPIVVVATYRPDDAPTRSPFHALLPTLVREARPTRLNLAPLDPAAIETLVLARYALPEADARRLARYLVQRSDGNAFFLGELLRALEEEGGLVATAAGWRIADLRATRVPTVIRQIIGERLARFGESERAALTAAAVIGQEIPIALWQQIGALRDEELLPLLDRAVAARVLIASEDGESVRFYHALTREVLYEGLLPPRRRAWHRAIGEALMALPISEPDSVAHHFERAGDARAAEWLIRAGERAQGAYAYLTAADRFEAAMRCLGEHEALSGMRGWLTLRLTWLRFFYEPAQSAHRVGDVLRLAADAEDEALIACARFSLGHFLVTSGDFRSGLRDIRAGVAALDALPDGEAAWRAALRTLKLPLLEPFHPRGVLAATLAYSGHFAEARAVGEQVAQFGAAPVAGRDEYRVDTMQAYLGLGIAYASLGEPEQSRRAFAAARTALRTSQEYLLTSLVDLYEFTFPIFTYQPDDVAERRRLVAATQHRRGQHGRWRDRRSSYWLVVWYNRHRRHSALGYRHPVAYEEEPLLLSSDRAA